MVQDGELFWVRPERRGLLPLDGRFHVSRRLGRTIRRGRFVCTADRAFDAVLRGCANREEGTWISPEIAVAYAHLHELGLAHSVEAWPADGVGVGEPVGGLYGVSLGGGFFAESMFHTVTDAGKVALVWCVEHLRRGGYRFCDIQWTTPHLERFGAYELPAEEYQTLLAEALEMECEFPTELRPAGES
jgi:leucyl/phenylalanyl-tRNA--protein transferase